MSFCVSVQSVVILAKYDPAFTGLIMSDVNVILQEQNNSEFQYINNVSPMSTTIDG